MTRITSNKKKLVSIYKRLFKFYGPQRWWPADTPFEVIIGAILTQNTAWSNVEKAIARLKERDVLSPKALWKLNKKELSRLIKSAGFYNLKAARLRNFLFFLSSCYNFDLKKMARSRADCLRNKLLAINGIGPETCDSILLYAFKKPVFVVDAYTKRVFSRHGIVREDNDYHEIQSVFTKHLPAGQKLFNEYHALIVKLAKDFCRKKPRCDACPLKTKFLPCKDER